MALAAPHTASPRLAANFRHDSTTVRLSADLHDKIEGAAARKGRNVSREIETRLNQSFSEDLSVQSISEIGSSRPWRAWRLPQRWRRLAGASVNNQPVVKETPPRPAVSWLDDPVA